MFKGKGSLFRRIFIPLSTVIITGLLLLEAVLFFTTLSGVIDEKGISLKNNTLLVAELIDDFIDSAMREYADTQREGYVPDAGYPGGNMNDWNSNGLALHEYISDLFFFIEKAIKDDNEMFLVTFTTSDSGVVTVCDVICGCKTGDICFHNAAESKKWIQSNLIEEVLENTRKNPEEANTLVMKKSKWYSLSPDGGTVYETDKIGLFSVTYYEKADSLLVATTPIRAGDVSFRNIYHAFLIAMIVALLALYIFVYLFVAKVTKPLSQMVSATKKYAEGDFSLRISSDREDELGELINSFNTMATALSITETSRRSFVANVSHELKTPMTTIGGFIDGIRDGTIPPEKRDYYLQIVSSEIKRLSRLVVSMLNLSRIEEGQTNLKLTDFNISKLLVDTVLTFEKGIESKGIGITGLDTLDSIFVNADEDMINQVIYNLIENAVKFTPENGRIDFRISETENDVEIEIGNTGNGIASELLPRIFERFYKVDASRSYDKKGAGLGLYLVKTLVELHGGKVDVSSREGEYTQFRFSIPKKSDNENRGEDNE